MKLREFPFNLASKGMRSKLVSAEIPENYPRNKQKRPAGKKRGVIYDHIRTINQPSFPALSSQARLKIVSIKVKHMDMDVIPAGSTADATTRTILEYFESVFFHIRVTSFLQCCRPA
ncbi:hypothetical protein GWI33_020649 [Rhynchophorus ferrugineus]|uniref:Uncharacterized protein n=1 Tax=Rhynchophorus ferrugineus TaxID=354439 RepID=A0A834M086_RHYFE|nr:hypothetical protein GWI33_020649 [Rhynchophorus ferrugineus]